MTVLEKFGDADLIGPPGKEETHLPRIYRNEVPDTSGKESSTCNAGDKEIWVHLRSGRYPGGGMKTSPAFWKFFGNPMDRSTWWPRPMGMWKSQTWLKQSYTHKKFNLGPEKAQYGFPSSTLAQIVNNNTSDFGNLKGSGIYPDTQRSWKGNQGESVSCSVTSTF